MIKRPLFYVACIFLCGILYGLEERILGLIFGGIILLCGVIPFWFYKQKKKALLYLFISLFVFLITIPYARVRLRNYESHNTFYAGPRNFGEFDAKQYYKSISNRSVSSFPLEKLRAGLEEIYASLFDEEEAAFLSAIILGDKAGVEANQKEKLQKAGIAHILSVSGLHISLLGMGMYRLLRRARLSFLCSGVGALSILVCYLFMTGNGISTQRAVIMFAISAIARWRGRKIDIYTSLGSAFMILLIDNPFYIYNGGFQLSFTAILGLGLWAKKRDDVKKKGWALIKERVTENISVSCGIFVFTLPISLSLFYSFTPYTIATNLLVLPLMTPIVLIGILIAFVRLPLLVIIEKFLIRIVLGISSFVSSLPWAEIITGKPSLIKILLFYLCMLIAALFIKRRSIKPFLVIGMLAFICISRSAPIISFLDVGQGDAVFICTEGESSVFIDGGSTSVSGVGQYRILPYLKASGVRQIDAWFVSHFDEDHISGLKELIEANYPIKQLFISSCSVNDKAAEPIIEMAKSKGTEIIEIRRGDRVRVDEYEFECLWPKQNSDYDDRNDGSLALRVDNGNISLLFCGDMSSKVEKEMIGMSDISPVDVYKCSHHGSDYSTSEELLDIIKPKVSIVSCARYNHYGHPGSNTIHRLKMARSQILYTMESGEIDIKRVGAKYIFQEFLKK